MIDSVNVTANTDAVKISILPSTNDVDVSLNPEYIKIEVGSTLTASSGSFVIGETPSGAINGINATYTTAQNFDADSIALFVNGIQATKGVDYTTSGTNTINFSYSLATGDLLRANYKV